MKANPDGGMFFTTCLGLAPNWCLIQCRSSRNFSNIMGRFGLWRTLRRTYCKTFRVRENVYEHFFIFFMYPCTCVWIIFARTHWLKVFACRSYSYIYHYQLHRPRQIDINMITKCLLNKRDHKSGRLYERVDDEHYPHDALGRGFALAELMLARHIHNLKNKEDYIERIIISRFSRTNNVYFLKLSAILIVLVIFFFSLFRAKCVCNIFIHMIEICLSQIPLLLNYCCLFSHDT